MMFPLLFFLDFLFTILSLIFSNVDFFLSFFTSAFSCVRLCVRAIYQIIGKGLDITTGFPQSHSLLNNVTLLSTWIFFLCIIFFTVRACAAHDYSKFPIYVFMNNIVLHYSPFLRFYFLIIMQRKKNRRKKMIEKIEDLPGPKNDGFDTHDQNLLIQRAVL